jgi:FkbH-like protein
MDYLEIITKNRELGSSLKGEPYKVAVYSNITIHLIKDVLEYELRKNGINAIVDIGNYDNIVQDSFSSKQYNAVIFFWEPSNFSDGFYYTSRALSEDGIKNSIDQMKANIISSLKNCEDVPVIMFNKFSSIPFNFLEISANNFDYVCSELNKFLVQIKKNNLILIDLEKIFMELSVDISLDYRNFYRAKSLYTHQFFEKYAEFIGPIIFSAIGRKKKALLLDCDNTLWKGVIGEDGINGIEISSSTPYGSVFHEIQTYCVELARNGIIVGLCSKNNPEDVEEVLTKHKDQILKNDNITIKKINWGDKSENLQNISRELNLGLDSFIFVDDSPYELELIKHKLPSVKTLKVPENIYNYPQDFKRACRLFFDFSYSSEDKNRTQYYTDERKREEFRTAYASQDSYLKNLKLSMCVFINDRKNINRLSQLTQKTNQFNLTTKRYLDRDIEIFMESDKSIIFSFTLEDIFGSYGITGLSIVFFDNTTKSALIDSFLMSCRVIGRTAEYSFLTYIITHLKKIGVERVEANYYKTKKNVLVKNFYETAGFTVKSQSEELKQYELFLEKYTLKKGDIIEIRD